MSFVHLHHVWSYKVLYVLRDLCLVSNFIFHYEMHIICPILNLFIYLFIYFWLRWVFVAARGLFSNCGEQGLLFVAVCRLLIAVASLVVEHWL